MVSHLEFQGTISRLHQSVMSDYESECSNEFDSGSTYGLYTEFELEDEDSDTFLSIKNRGVTNRKLATHDRLGKTWFAATLSLVRYGKYEGKPACLIGIDFTFGFRRQTLCRFVYSEIDVIFSQSPDKDKPELVAPDPDKDPGVVNFAPVEVWGVAKTIDQKSRWSVEVPLKWKQGVEAGVSTKVAMEKSLGRECRMSIDGAEMFDDDHATCANAIQWIMEENRAQQDGILKRFRGFVVVLLPEGANNAMWVKVNVRPSVEFSADPRRLFRKLKQKNDEPIYLDGKTPYPDVCDQNLSSDFGDPDFPWENLVVYPVEYAVCFF